MQPMVAAVGTIAAFAAGLFLRSLLNDGDTYWHLAMGDWMLQHGRVPRIDTFAYPIAGQEWPAHEWLAELAMAAAFRAGGWTGLIALFAATLAATVFIMGRELARRLPPVGAATTLAVAASCIGPSMLARPHLLALPLLTLWTAWLVAARDDGKPPWRLILIAILWANLHASFVIGLALLGAVSIEQWTRARSGELWLACCAAAVLAACLTPFGPAGIWFPIGMVQLDQIESIIEWRPPDFSRLQPIELALLAVLAVALRGGVRLSWLRLLILLSVLHLAIGHSRHGMLAGVIGSIVLAAPLGRRFGPPPPARGVPAKAIVTVAAALLAVRIALPVSRGDDRVSPVSALAAVPASLAAEPVLNDYDFGGYLIWKGVRTYVDGRAYPFGDASLHEYSAIAAGDRAALDRALSRWKIRWTLLRAGSAVAAEMDARPGWRRLYADRIAVVHVREITPGARD